MDNFITYIHTDRQIVYKMNRENTPAISPCQTRPSGTKGAWFNTRNYLRYKIFFKEDVHVIKMKLERRLDLYRPNKLDQTKKVNRLTNYFIKKL